VDISEIDFSALVRAKEALQAAVEIQRPSELERDGGIQRFEFTFELAWKTMRKVLIALGRANVSGSPKPILRDAFSEGLIDSIDLWFGFLDARNRSAHIYNETTAQEVWQRAKGFPAEVDKLIVACKR